MSYHIGRTVVDAASQACRDGEVRAAAGMTEDELRALPVTVDITTACRALGISRALGYRKAKNGQFPIRIVPNVYPYRVVENRICSGVTV